MKTLSSNIVTSLWCWTVTLWQQPYKQHISYNFRTFSRAKFKFMLKPRFFKIRKCCRLDRAIFHMFTLKIVCLKKDKLLVFFVLTNFSKIKRRYLIYRHSYFMFLDWSNFITKLCHCVSTKGNMFIHFLRWIYTTYLRHMTCKWVKIQNPGKFINIITPMTVT